ncbi:MAG: hypothetical protein KDB01_27035 [Planctomycetaceae bacterium]|nr:hypothetical protein [Planctomycetaceae bacterium]
MIAAIRAMGEAHTELLIVHLRVSSLILNRIKHGDRRAMKHVNSPALSKPTRIGLGLLAVDGVSTTSILNK